MLARLIKPPGRRVAAALQDILAKFSLLHPDRTADPLRPIVILGEESESRNSACSNPGGPSVARAADALNPNVLALPRDRCPFCLAGFPKALAGAVLAAFPPASPMWTWSCSAQSCFPTSSKPVYSKSSSFCTEHLSKAREVAREALGEFSRTLATAKLLGLFGIRSLWGNANALAFVALAAIAAIAFVALAFVWGFCA